MRLERESISPYRQFKAELELIAPEKFSDTTIDDSVTGQLFESTGHFVIYTRVKQTTKNLRYKAICGRCRKDWLELGHQDKFFPIFDDVDQQGRFYVLLCRKCYSEID